MATTGASSIQDLDLVVDVDAHLMESGADIAAYMDEPWDEVLAHTTGVNTYTGDPVSAGAKIEELYPSPGVFVPEHFGKTESQVVRSPEDVRQGHMADLNVDKTILTPTLNLYIGVVHHDDIATAMANAYNSWFLDTFGDADDDLHGAIVIARQQPDKAAEEIDDRAGEDAFVAVQFPSPGCNPPAGDERYHQIYQAAEDNGLPVLYHSASTGDLISTFGPLFQATNRLIEVHTVLHPAEHMVNLASILTNGVPELFPDIDFVFQEGGIGWLPYFMRRYEDEYLRSPEEAAILEKPPSEYIEDQVYIGSQPVEGIGDPQYLSSMIDLLGAQNLMFATDFPHYDFDTPDTFFHAIRQKIDTEDLDRIFGGNAESIFEF